MNITATIRSYIGDAGRAFDRAPAEVALALFSAIVFSYGIEHSEIGNEVVRTGIGAALAFFAAWSATLMHALGGITRRTRWLIVTAGALVAFAYLLLAGDLDRESEGWRAFMLVGGALLLTFSAPALPALADSPNLRLRRINARILLRSAGIILYGLALFGGLALALAAVDNLFELNLDSEIYLHVLVWIMIVLVPWVIVGGIGDYTAPLSEQSDVARVVHRLVTYLVPLLVAIYFVILYAYVIRIAVTGELPRNLVSPMVIASGLLSLVSLIVFDPGPTATSWRWLRFTPLAYLPLVPLGFWALMLRFGEYGWTEFRVLRVVALLAVAALAIAMAVRVVRRREFPLRLIPIVLGAALLLPAAGPWSASAVSRADQQRRLGEALREAAIDVRTPPDPADTTTRRVPQALYSRIESGTRYLASHFGTAAVRAVVPAYRFDDAFPDLTGYFRLAPIINDTLPQTFFARFAPGARGTLSTGVAYRIQLPGDHTSAARATVRGDTLFVVAGADSLRADLKPALTQVRAGRQRPIPIAVEQSALPVFDHTGAARGDLLLLDMTLTQEKGARRMVHLDAILLLR